ncbi:MAG: recombination regulator RecX [Bifidobacteriaceae bacterium]|jgi:regulatory protein|nr:recombination regulator RecX [Bifidobacteriaceae bacterium]
MSRTAQRQAARAEEEAADPEVVARSVALRLLARSPKSRDQLARAIASRGVPDQVAAGVLDRFEAVGLVDDTAFAEMLVRTRHTERGLTGPALAAELRRRGVDAEVAREAMEQVTPEDQLARAVELARKKLAATAGLDRQVRLRRTYATLARKGYPHALATRALDAALAQEA